MKISFVFTFLCFFWSFSLAQEVDSSNTESKEISLPSPSHSTVTPESPASLIPQASQVSETTPIASEPPIQQGSSEPLSKTWYAEYVARGLVTLIVGVLAFFLSQVYFRYRDREKREKDYLSLLSVTAEEIKRNLDSECQMHAYLYVNIMPTFELSFFVPENIFKELTNICQNYDLLKNLFKKYFEYRHIQNRVGRTKTLWDTLTNQPSPPQQMQQKYANERDDTAELIRGNIKGSFDTYNSIVAELKGLKEHDLSALSERFLDERYDYFQNSTEVQTAATQQSINLQARKKYY